MMVTRYHPAADLDSACPQDFRGTRHHGAVDKACRLSGVHGTMDAAKNEATRTADRANGQQMVRVSPPTSSEERKRLMPSIPPTPDGPSTCTNPHVDGCDQCVVNSEIPVRVDSTARGCLAEYRCTDCGYKWQTAWGCS